jgi:N6-adenosine-specific RNA methylase IME4
MLLDEITRPERGYSVVYADPPWQFQAWSHRGEGKGASQHYDCMTLQQVCDLPVRKVVADDAALFMWVVQPMLPDALRVIGAWGFEFKTVAFAWVKMKSTWTGDKLFYDPTDIAPRLGLGYHTRSGFEQCWLAVRGKGYKRRAQGVPQVLHAPLRQHSRKPDEVAARIETLVGDIPKIELFARSRRPGWDAWGHQVTKFPSAA